MRDFKFVSLLTGDSAAGWLSRPIEQPKSPVLSECITAFHMNLARTCQFQIMPVEMTYQGTRNAVFTWNSLGTILNKRSFTLDEMAALELTPELEAEFARQISEDSKTSHEEQVRLRLRFGTALIEGMLNENLPAPMAAIDALFASIVVQSWTAFECLVGDLWVLAIDHGPKKWIEQLVQSKQINKKEMPGPRWGSHLRAKRKVTFQTLPNIRRLYEAAFGELLAMEFNNVAGGHIVALSAIRNVLTHRAGLTDSTFLEQVAHFPEFSRYKVSEPVLLDGECVKRLRQASLELGLALISFVDDEIARAEGKKPVAVV